MGLASGPLETLGLNPPYPDPALWKGRRVWLSGHTGFKGAWLAFWLRQLGAEVCGYSLPASTNPSLFELLGLQGQLDHEIADIRDAGSVNKSIQGFKPEVVFHLAAQALVRPGYEDPSGTFGTNIMGTANILESIRQAKTVRIVVAVTTDKVYRNLESGRPFREDDALGGRDPYSASKAGAEMVISCYRESFFRPAGIAVAAARAGNVIGGGDWSKDRILPDAVRAWVQGRPLVVRNPCATRPWQHVLEPLNSYLCLAEALLQNPSLAADYNFGPPPDQNTNVQKVVELAKDSFGAAKIHWGETTAGPHEAKNLALDNRKAEQTLGIKPIWTLKEAIKRTMNWYRRHHKGEDASKLCQEDLAVFCSKG